MKSFVWVAMVLAALVAVAAASPTSNVVDLTADNFDSAVDGSRPVFVEFFAPWCGHCKNLAPVWEQLADAFAGSKNKVIIAKVDADAHKEVGGRFDIKGFPTIKLFKDNVAEPETYNGGRDLDALLSYIEKETGAKAKRPTKAASHVVILTKNNFDSEIINDASSGALVEFYAPWCGHCKRLEPEFEKLARAFMTETDVKIAKIDCDANGDLCKKFEVSGYPTLKWFPKEDKANPIPYEGGRTIDDLVKSVNKQFGLDRQADGRPGSAFGRLAALDEIVANYAARTAEEKDAIVTKVKEAASSLKDEISLKAHKAYARVLELLQKKPDHLTTETERLTRMLENGGALQPAKLDEFQARLNVLEAFHGYRLGQKRIPEEADLEDDDSEADFD